MLPTTSPIIKKTGATVGFFLFALIFLWAPAAHAYIGPGAGFALVSSFLTLLIAFFTAFFALLTFPIRMLIRFIKRRGILGKAKVKKVIILGLDGLDPEICDRMIARGEMPHFAQLASDGVFRRLGTSVPAMSPVAWSSFSTGVDASRHGIFDFLTRDPRTYAPILSSSSVSAGNKFLNLWKFRIPLKKGRVNFLRKSKSFWKVLSEYGIFSTVLRVPITFPPEKINGVLLSGMCVPDLRGTMGSFTYFTQNGGGDKIGGTVIQLQNNGSALQAELPGPASPVENKTLALPLTVRRIDANATIKKPKNSIGADTKAKKFTGPGAEITIGDQKIYLHEKEYSEWVRLTFKAGPGMKLRGIARFYITKLDGDFGLYCSPIHIDPESPAMPISSPPYYSIYLAKKFGPYGTLGLAEDTWAVNEGVLDEKAFLDQAYKFHRERETMFLESVKKLKEGMVCCVFDLSDRLQHMFFRYLDETHAANKDRDVVEHQEALYEMYREMDRLLAKTLKYVDKKTALFVISDHGFKSFRTGVDLNAWLKQNDLLYLRDDASPDSDYLLGVDWTRTKAYAVGLGGIFINKIDRERKGIVSESDYINVKEEIKQKLIDLENPSSGERAVRRIFDVEKDFTGPYRKQGPDLIVGFTPGYRVSWDCAKGKVNDIIIEDNIKSWSGDHCMDPDSVPGILFSNLKIEDEKPRLMDIGPTVLNLFGVETPKYMTGKSLIRR